MLALDFETYYDKDNTVDGRQANSGSPESYIENLFLLDKPPYLISLYSSELEYCGPLSLVPWADFETNQLNSIICCHNARFDAAIFKACADRGLVPNNWLTDCQWVCTADMAAFNQAPRDLAGAAKVLLNLEVSKDTRAAMRGVDFGRLSLEKRKEVQEYCLKDSVLCYQLAKLLLPEWPRVEQAISSLNREIGMYGVQLDTQLIEEGLQKLYRIMFEAEAKLPWRDDPSADTAILSVKEVCRRCREAGIPVPSRINEKGEKKPTLAEDEPEVEDWETNYGEQYPWVGAMRDYRKANILVKKLSTMKRHSVRGVLHFGLKYFGAHTGRFSGSGGLNLQNLPNRKESFVSLRQTILPRLGNRLCVVDWCQIEPRILRWVVKDQVALDLLASGVSIYEVYAIQHFKWVSGEVSLKKANPALYGLAKAAVLGAGYGCGGVKYQSVAYNMAGITLTPTEAAEQVRLFRKNNPKVVDLWNNLAFAAKVSAMEHRPFIMSLPSGRSMTYYEPTMKDGLKASTLRDNSRITFYHGGKLTENYIQAIARDVFSEGMLRLEMHGFQNLFHVHDEYVLEIPLAVDKLLAEKHVRETLCAPYAWLPGCPLDVDIKWKENYGG